MFNSIRSKLILSYLTLIFITLIIIGLFGASALQDYNQETLQKEQLEEAAIIGELLADPLSRNDQDQLKRLVRNLGQKINSRITVIDLDGDVLADSHFPTVTDNLWGPSEFKRVWNGGGMAFRGESSGEKEQMLIVAHPIEKNGVPLAVVRLAVPLSQVKIYPLVLKLLVGSILLVALAAVPLIFSFARRLTEPIYEIMEMTKRIRAGDFSQKIIPRTRDEMGQLVRAINQMATTIREKVEELSLVNGRLETVLNYMPSGVLLLNSRGEIILANPAAETILGITEANYLGRHNLEVIRNYHLNERAKETLNSGDLITGDLKLLYPEEREIRAYYAPLPLEKAAQGVLVVLHDITALRRLERMRTDFVANASHELRTPLTAIKGFAETLLDGALADPQTSRKFVSIIDQEAERLIRLVEDLLDLAKLEAEKMEMEKRPLSLSSLVAEVVLELQPRMHKGGLTLEVDVSPDLPQILGDSGWLHQVLLNLLDNSIKYTPSGGRIKVGAWLEGNEIKVEVDDTGVGIPQKDLPRIFERFYRVDKARSRQLGGTGLGLSIVKHVIEKHGGKIGIKSEEGKGTKVWFTLPLAKGTVS